MDFFRLGNFDFSAMYKLNDDFLIYFYLRRIKYKNFYLMLDVLNILRGFILKFWKYVYLFG